MKKIITTIILIFISSFFLISKGDELALKIVNQCANIKQNDIVLITGGVRNLKLLEDIATQVRKIGAFPLVRLASDRMNRLYYDEVPEKFDSQAPLLDLKLAKIINAAIGISYNENQGLFSDVPPERFATLSKAYIPVNQLIVKRNVRQVDLGNNLYPTLDRAKLYGVSLEKLTKIFWNGVNTDYMKLKKIGETVQTKLAAGNHLHITNPNGTDLKIQIKGKQIFVSDGIISEADINKGGPSCMVWLPAGEVYTTPVPGTATGKVVVDRLFYQGKEIKGLALTFKAGKLTSMKAESGLKPLKDLYDTAGPGKERFAFIDIGINPNVQIIPDSRMVAFMATGMITVGIGNNIWAGGDNECEYGITFFLPNTTLKVDNKVLVEKGVLKH